MYFNHASLKRFVALLSMIDLVIGGLIIIATFSLSMLSYYVVSSQIPCSFRVEDGYSIRSSSLAWARNCNVSLGIKFLI